MQGRSGEIKILDEDIRRKLERQKEWQRRTRTRQGRREHEQDLRQAGNDLKAVRKEKKRKLKEWEHQWWQGVIKECTEEYQRGNTGKMYKKLRELGKRGKCEMRSGSTITKEQFKEYFEEISGTRYELPPQKIEKAVEEIEDMRTSARAMVANDFMNKEPSDEEIEKTVKETKYSAPGREGVRIKYIWNACEEIKEQLRKNIIFMFSNRANHWESSIKKGHMVPIFKKGNKNTSGNYRGVVLLAMESRVLARVIANRLLWWSENMRLIDESQNGIREGRSTADKAQIITRIQEDTRDLKKRIRIDGREQQHPTDPEARLLDLRKAYPRVNKSTMWEIVKRCGLKGKFLETILDFHESMEYCVKGKDGDSEPWTPERGLREGCLTSPSLFNIYHQVAMRAAERERRNRAEEEGRETGIPWKWVPGNVFPSMGLWERQNSEAIKYHFTAALFADDTTVLGERDNIETEVGITKEKMGTYEERTNDDKEETLIFAEDESEDIRMLGCWMGPSADVRNRIGRANSAWWKLKDQLKHSTLSKRIEARIIEACLESSPLFDCNTRVWYISEIKLFKDGSVERTDMYRATRPAHH